jgi:hypothetical protein
MVKTFKVFANFPAQSDVSTIDSVGQGWYPVPPGGFGPGPGEFH